MRGSLVSLSKPVARGVSASSTSDSSMERATGIEPAFSGWEVGTSCLYGQDFTPQLATPMDRSGPPATPV